MICHNAKGEMCLAGDPNRLVWFGDCGYWTDNFDLIFPKGMIGPNYRCPKCNAILRTTFTAFTWTEGADKWNRDHPGYEKWINDNKEVCFGAEYDNILFIKGFSDLEMKERMV